MPHPSGAVYEWLCDQWEVLMISNRIISSINTINETSIDSIVYTGNYVSLSLSLYIYMYICIDVVSLYVYMYIYIYIYMYT